MIRMIRLAIPLVIAALMMAGWAAPAQAAKAKSTLRIGDRAVAEAATTVKVRVTLRGKHGPVRVKYRTVDGSAKAGQDYIARTGTLRFGPRTKTRTIAVRILDDSATEPAESFGVALSRARGARIADGRATVRIAASDPVIPPATLTIERTGGGSGQITADPVAGRLDHCDIAGHPCSGSYARGTRVTLTFEAYASAQFLAWSGGGCSGTTPTCTVTMDRDQVVTVSLKERPQPFDVYVVGPGSVTAENATDFTCSGTHCTGLVEPGQFATITAVPDDPASSVSWQLEGVPTCAGQLTCTVPLGKELRAFFTAPTGR